MSDNQEQNPQNNAPQAEVNQEQQKRPKKPPIVHQARQQQRKSLMEHLERTRNDNGQRMTTNAVEMKSKLSLVVTLDGIYSAPRYEMVVKDKIGRSKFYPSENRKPGSPPPLLKNHVARWQNNMEAAEGRGAVATPRHTMQTRVQQKRRLSAGRKQTREYAAEAAKDKDHEREG